MKIEIKRLTLSNFKGIRSLTISFNQVTNILGDNATGKTTLMDAFLWLFFGKDSTDRKDFEIKTLDENNQPFHHLDHEVEAVLVVDGNEITLRRSMREKWVKTRGATTSEFKGHEIGYFWNDVPMKQEEYQAKIAGLVDERLFKLITNTTYFNNLKWQDRRAVLIQMAGKIDDSDILKDLCKRDGPAGYEDLIFALNTKTVDEYKRELVAKKKKLKDELLLLPSRIEEAGRALPEEKNYKEIEILLNDAVTNLETTDGLLMNKTRAAKEHQIAIAEKIKEAGELRSQNHQIEFEERNNVQLTNQDRQLVIIDKKATLRTKLDERNRLLGDYNTDILKLERLQDEKMNLTKNWERKNNDQLVFDDNDFHCPACKRAFEDSDIESKKSMLIANFNSDKAKRLDEIVTQGKKTADEILILTSKIATTTLKGVSLKSEIEVLQTDIAVLDEEFATVSATSPERIKHALHTNTIWQANNEKIGLLNEEINTPFKADDNTELLARKRDLSAKLDALKAELQTKGQREKQLARIAELEQQEQNMAQELASLEGVEYSIEQFTKAKMDTLESRINGRFKLVQFKMFEEQINGGQVEACTTLISGVPYSDANTAGKIQAGLDIINTMSEHWGVMAPVWVDNRESIIRLPETKCQLINLIVSAPDKKLRIENAVKMEAIA
jgi:AAA15 family ATPase/GTPase